MNEDKERFRKLGLTCEEMAFYDILIKICDEKDFEYCEVVFGSDLGIIINKKKDNTFMPSSKECLDFILEQLSGLEEISYKKMMGEYIIYYKEKIIGGIYDDRFLVKPTKSAIELLPDATYEIPYEGAKEMLLVDNVDSKDFLAKLFNAMYEELPLPKKKGK